MIFDKYDSYKDSGVDWLGEIPSHWRVKRVKDFCKVNKETLSENRIFNKEIAYVDIGSVDANYGITTVENMYFSEAPSRARRIVRNGDIIISTVRTYLKAIAYIDKNFTGSIVSTGFATLTPNNGLISKYLYYSVFSNYFIERIIAYSVGVSYPAIDSSFLRCNFVLIAKKEEQIKISNFLDQKTSQIDIKIKLLQEKKESYEELKKSLINETVCHGLYKDVELKESGIEWIGKIPKHWKIERLKDQFSLIPSGIYSFKEEKDYLSTKSISINKIEKIEEKITFKKRPSRANMQPIINSVWFAKLRFTKKSYLFDDLEEAKKYILSTGFAGLRTKNINSKFVNYYICSEYFLYQKDSTSHGTTQEAITEPNINQIIFICPPKEEQIQIANYLDNNTLKIDKIVSKINDQIETLKELRKTLINDLITGKVKIQDE